MPYRRIFFEKQQPFHILSRAVEGCKIFNKEDDCYRFIFQSYAANSGKPAFNLRNSDVVKTARALLNGEEIPSRLIIKQHPPLVQILDFALVINHYHFYLLPNIKNSVPIYMKKLNGGFAKFFNLKYHRKGSVFGSRYQSIPVETEFQSDAVSRYISVINPLDVYQPGWRENGLKNLEEAFRFLKRYQLSSFPDRIGERRSKILASPEVLERYYFNKNPGEKVYIDFVKDFLEQKLASFDKFFLE